MRRILVWLRQESPSFSAIVDLRAEFGESLRRWLSLATRSLEEFVFGGRGLASSLEKMLGFPSLCRVSQMVSFVALPKEEVCRGIKQRGSRDALPEESDPRRDSLPLFVEH